MSRFSQPLATLFSRLLPWQARLLLLVVTALLVLLLRAGLGSTMYSLEEQVGGLGWRLAADGEAEQRFSIVAIDEQSLQQVGPWPWPRETWARLSDKLAAAGVQMQLYDVAFPDAQIADAEFAAALSRNNGVLPQVPDLQNSQALVRSGNLGFAVSGASCDAAVEAQNFIGNAPAFTGVPKGHIATWVDSDGAVRKVPAYICVDGAAYPAMGISALLQATMATQWEVAMAPGAGVLGAPQQLTLPAYPGLAIPLDADGNLRVSFRKAPETFQAFSAADILNDRIDPALLENTWVLVGYTAFGLVDIVPTPYNGAAHGVELQARILGSILDNNVPYTPRAAGALHALLTLAFASLLWFFASARDRMASYGLAAAGVVLPLLAVALHVQVLTQANLWLGWLNPALFAFTAAGLLLLHELARVRLERSRVFGNLSSYLPAEVAEEIAFALPDSSVNAHRKNVTLLSADLRNFSAYGESRPPEESAALLHFFFMKTTAIIEQHQGRVHEFKGDSLLAIWDGSDSAAAAAALQAAHEMQRTMIEVLPQHPPAGLEPLALGIGIEQGPVLIGSIGPAHRRSHTLLGETVTITLRIQEMTAELAHPILIGECAARQLAEHGLISQGSYLLSGLRNPHILYAPPMRDPSQWSARNDNPPLRLLRGGRS